MQCDTCGNTVNQDDIYCNEAGQEYCEHCHVNTELWLFRSVLQSESEHINLDRPIVDYRERYCKSCTVVTVNGDDKYCAGCIDDIVTYLAASYIATDALKVKQIEEVYLQGVQDHYNELLLSSENGHNYTNNER